MDVAGDRPPRILIGICSGRGMADRRAAVRETWLRAIPDQIEAAFFVGEGPGDAEPGVVCLAAGDGYDHLSVKVHAFYRHALERFTFDYLFKCDDDTYVHLERLAALARRGLDFAGSPEFTRLGFASGGAGYLMSRATVEHFVREPVAPRCDEDVVFSDRVRRDCMRWAATEALHGLGARFPDFDNDMITGHWCPPARMRAVHAAVTGSDHGQIMLDLRAAHHAWSGVIRLFGDGVFWSRGPASPHGSWHAADAGRRLLLRWTHWPLDTLHLDAAGFVGADLRLEFSRAEDHAVWQALALHA